MSAPARVLATCDGELELGGRPWLMGIVNATPDSFSDAGLNETLDARVTLTARTLLVRLLRGDAVLLLPRGRIDGLTVTNARMAVDWNLMPAAGRGDHVVRAARGRLGVVDACQGGHPLSVRLLPGGQPGAHPAPAGGGPGGGRA